MDPLEHCLNKIIELSSSASAPSTRDVFQIGYNAGRAAELAGEGREQWWDLFKEAVAQENWGRVAFLARQKLERRQASYDENSSQ